MADPREAWIAGRGRRSIEDARRKAAANTPEVMMSQTPEWYQNRENLSRAKDVLGNIPAVTTDQDESRNMYQMLMNQMKGGDKGARLIDRSGLPAGARRYGRTLFTDPAKSQGFFGDVGSLLSGKNRAAVRAPEYNPFPMAGFGKDFFYGPVVEGDPTSGLGGRDWGGMLQNIMPFGIGTLGRMFSREREPLERDPRYAVPRSADWESSIFDPVEDITEDIDIEDLSYTPETVWGPGGDPSIGMAGMEEDEPLDFDWTDLWMTDKEDDLLGEEEDITETITEDDGEEKFVLKEAKFSRGNLGTEGKYDYSPNLDLNIMNIKDAELRKKATDAAIQFNNVWLEGEDGEYYGQLEDLYQEYLDAVEAGAQPEDSLIEDINLTEDDFEGVAFDFDKNLEDQAESLNEIERLKNIQRDNNWLFDI